MAGFRTFATGEVLTAANVNDFLMKQSVMVFDDATARTTALGAEVIEGMLTYNKDTDQLEVFDGTNFVVAAPEPPAQNLVAVKSAVKTGVQVDASIATGAGVVLTDLSITHAAADAGNTIYLYAMTHLRAGTGSNGHVGVILKAGATALGLGDADGSRTRLTAFDGLFNNSSGSPNGFNGMQANITALASHTPGSTASVTYTVDAVNMVAGAQTVHCNRSSANPNAASDARPSSTLILFEVRV